MIRPAMVALLLVSLLIPAGGWWLLQRPLPRLDGNLFIGKLDGSVVVKFDSRAVPYIRATTQSDAYAAQGFITARERMFQMDMLRRTANGELSEVFGAQTLPSDRLMRTIGINRLAKDELKNLSDQTRRALEAYTWGVNSYLQSNFTNLPLEFALLGYSPKPWQAVDTLAVLKYLSYQMDESWRLDDLRQRISDRVGQSVTSELFSDQYVSFALPPSAKPASATPAAPASTATPAPTGKGAPSATLGPASERSSLPVPLSQALSALNASTQRFFPPNRSLGSTAIVVSRDHSTTGGALLAADKHTELQSPSPWFMTSIEAPGLHTAGACIPGVPGVVVGRNEYVSWSSASLKADVQDLFVEQFKSDLGPEYRVGSGWQSATVTSEAIPVRLGTDVDHKIYSTKHGPVLLRTGTTGVSINWTGFDTSRPSLNAIYKVNRASNWSEFVEAMKDYGGSPQMFVYADVGGNIGSQAAGIIPTRNQSDGSSIEVGWQKQGEWTGQVAFEKLPQSLVVSGEKAKQKVLVAANQKLNQAGGPEPLAKGVQLGHQASAPFRANRALAVMLQSGPLSTPALSDISADKYAYLSPELKKALQKALTATQSNDRVQRSVIDLLNAWNNQQIAESASATIYNAFLNTLARRFVEPQLGRSLTDEYMQRWDMWPTLVERLVREQPLRWLPPEERTFDTFFATTLTQAIKGLRISYATNDPRKWSWQNIHLATFKHVASSEAPWFGWARIGPFGSAGNKDAALAIDATTDSAGLRFEALTGPTQRIVIDMADSDKFYQTVSPGQSGHLFSPHRADQVQSWLNADPLPVAFSKSQIDRQATHTLILDNNSQ